jgi:hypothetical protein
VENYLHSQAWGSLRIPNNQNIYEHLRNKNVRKRLDQGIPVCVRPLYPILLLEQPLSGIGLNKQTNNCEYPGMQERSEEDSLALALFIADKIFE